MRQKLPWLIATFIAACGLTMLAQQQQPIQTGGFSPGPAPVTLVLLNQSSLPDSTVAEIANTLTGKVAGVALANRLFGVGVCGTGEWCLPITNQMVGSGSDAAAGAAVGAGIAQEIVRKMLAALQI
jgi:hypothetical protein